MPTNYGTTEFSECVFAAPTARGVCFRLFFARFLAATPRRDRVRSRDALNLFGRRYQRCSVFKFVNRFAGLTKIVLNTALDWMGSKFLFRTLSFIKLFIGHLVSHLSAVFDLQTASMRLNSIDDRSFNVANKCTLYLLLEFNLHRLVQRGRIQTISVAPREVHSARKSMFPIFEARTQHRRNEFRVAGEFRDRDKSRDLLALFLTVGHGN